MGYSWTLTLTARIHHSRYLSIGARASSTEWYLASRTLIPRLFSLLPFFVPPFAFAPAFVFLFSSRDGKNLLLLRPFVRNVGEAECLVVVKWKVDLSETIV